MRDLVRAQIHGYAVHWFMAIGLGSDQIDSEHARRRRDQKMSKTIEVLAKAMIFCTVG